MKPPLFSVNFTTTVLQQFRQKRAVSGRFRAKMTLSEMTKNKAVFS
jgi:hypothetical protein